MKLLLIAGARPNFMKIAPIIKAAKTFKGTCSDGQPLTYRLVHTGQHYDQKMSDIFFQELGIPQPDINLGVGSGSHAVQTANIMLKFEPVLLQEKPDWVVVVGDVNSTLACTIVASKLGIKVAHVEAGLRSYDRTMPEEINRIVTDSLADLLLTPSTDADENLAREGVARSKIKFVGNVMIDALVSNLEMAHSSGIKSKFDLKPKRFAYVTLHRPSNVDCPESLPKIMAALKSLAGRLTVVFPMHPRTRKMCSEFGISVSDANDLKIIDPIGYHDSLWLTENARLVLTDSGGLQEESTFFRTPCLTLRPNTERPVTISLGSNKLTDIHTLNTDIEALMNNGAAHGSIPPLWDGKTAERIIQCLMNT